MRALLLIFAMALIMLSMQQGPSGKLAKRHKQQIERSFTSDFGSVRQHLGGRSQQLGSQAYAVGSNIAFAPGPQSDGRYLIAHEVAHVAQQRA
jgi:hypothetical protein